MELITKTYIEVDTILIEVILVGERYTTKIYKNVNNDIYYIVDVKEPIAEFCLGDNSKLTIYDEYQIH